MFTSLRSRLWLSYAFLIAVALAIVALVLLVFLIRNPVLTRQLQQQLRIVQSLISANPQEYLENSDALQKLAQENKVRVLLFSAARVNLWDSNPGESPLPPPRRNLLGRNSQTTLDAQGRVWLYISSRTADSRILMVAA